MASSTGGTKRRGNFKLDIDDMERRLVEFRIMMDREKRRCQAAKMTDKFEKMLVDKLTEIGSQLTAAAGGGAGGGATQGGPGNGPTWTQPIDKESAGKLDNLLTVVITQSGRVEQLDSIHEILRQNLLKARLKRVRTAADLPAGQAQPLEPLCGYCGSFSKDSELLQAPQAQPCNVCLLRDRQPEAPIEIQVEDDPDPVPTMDDLRQSFSQYDPPAPNSGASRQQDNTPPASNPTTPEVGEQATGFASYTPNFGGGDHAHQRPFTPAAANSTAPAASDQEATGVSYTPNFGGGGGGGSSVRAQQQQITPPASNPTTPEVGEQAQGATYTPNLAPAHQKERQLVLPRPVASKQPAPVPPPRKQPQQPQQQPQQPHQQRQLDNINSNTNASNSCSRFVMPSDESSTDSETQSVRDVLDKLAHTPAGYFEQRPLSSTPMQKEKKERKRNLADEDDERPAKLVIDEQCQGLDLSFASKSIKKGPRSKTRPKRPNSSQQRA